MEEQGSGAESESPDGSWGPLAAALEQIGCHLETVGVGRVNADAPSLPSVTFRAPGTLLTDILDLVSELSNRPPCRARLSHVWCVESRPSRHGGTLHTLTPRRENARTPLSDADFQAARRDSETLAAFLLLRRGQPAEAPSQTTARRATRVPAVGPAEARTRAYFHGTVSVVPPVAASP